MRKSDFSCRNGGPLRKISMSELAEHNSQFDCWTAYNGKVYNITQYLHYHPGGVPKLLEGAGKDCTKLFNKYHAWVNIDSMLSKCVVGILMSDEKGFDETEEGEGEAEGEGEGEGDTSTALPKSDKEDAKGQEFDKDIDELRKRARGLLQKNEDDI